METSLLIEYNKLVIEGYSDTVALSMAKIIISQRRKYPKVMDRISFEEREEERREFKESKTIWNSYTSYRKEVDRLTEKTAYLLDGIEKRGFLTYHVDHIVPVYYGYRNKIDPSVIADPINLRVITRDENYKKRNKLTEESIRVLARLQLV